MNSTAMIGNGRWFDEDLANLFHQKSGTAIVGAIYEKLWQTRLGTFVMERFVWGEEHGGPSTYTVIPTDEAVTWIRAQGGYDNRRAAEAIASEPVRTDEC